jgi:predicted O-linked N-acetylglucosamine transferase (SPINDLY family)
MEYYNDVDICLDPFPYQGGVTTSEALYMGCPVITMNNKGVNTSTSILKAAGLEEYLAKDQEEYIQKAVQMARIMAMLAPEKRMAIREHMRDTIMKSRIFNADLFARDLENGYETVLRDGR